MNILQVLWAFAFLLPLWFIGHQLQGIRHDLNIIKMNYIVNEHKELIHKIVTKHFEKDN